MILRNKLLLVVLLMLISIASCVQIDKTTGPFKVSFALPVDTVTTDVPEPYQAFSDFAQYAVTTTADTDNWYAKVLISEYIGGHETDINAERRSVAASANVDESQVSNRLIDGKSAVYAVNETNNYTTLAAGYWLDANNGYGTKYAEITIGASVPANEAMAVLDTLKISSEK